jgi:hypothetical protein
MTGRGRRSSDEAASGAGVVDGELGRRRESEREISWGGRDGRGSVFYRERGGEGEMPGEGTAGHGH